MHTDTLARAHAIRDQSSRERPDFNYSISPDQVASLAVSAFFDYVAAFPSVFHHWIEIVLAAIQAPVALVNTFRAMYHNVQAYMVVGGQLKHLFQVRAGVMQGCPLSALLFNFALDPLLWLFDSLVVVPQFGKVWACADDLAATVRCLEHLKQVAKAFDIFAKFSGLHLGHAKCCIVLNSVVASPSNIALVKAWLIQNIPNWSNFCISNHAKYLGIQMGPSAGSVQWLDSIGKFKSRVSDIAASGESAALCFRQYSARAVPVLTYVSQLITPPQ